MLNRLSLAIALACAVAFASPAAAQSNPNLTKGQVLTAGQWNALFAGKQDTLGFVPASTAGAAFTGRVVTPASGASLSGFNITPGGVPASPANGDLWMTSAGLFVRVAGTTVGPLAGATTSSFAATAPLSVTFPGGITTYACATCGVTTSPLSQFANTTSAQLLGMITDETGSGSLVFATSPTLVTPVLGVATATSINKVAITAPATSATLTIANGKTLTVNNSLGFTGTDGTTFTFPGTSDTVVTLTAAQTLTNKTLTAPALGAATATSLAIGGATIGSNALAVTGTTQFNGPAIWNSANANALAVGQAGTTNPAFQVNASAASSATGIVVSSAAAGSAAGLSVISSGTNEALVVNAKGNGTINIGANSTGAVVLAAGGGGVIGNGAFTTSGSISATASDANFNAGGQRAVMDIAGGAARIGSVNGGGAATTTSILVNGGSAITFGTSGLPTAGTAVSTVGGFPVTVASGTVALGTAAIPANTCGTVATATATGAATTDVIDVGFNTDPTGVTGYTPTSMLSLVVYPTTNTVNVKQCNLTGGSITPAALTLNWRVRR